MAKLNKSGWCKDILEKIRKCIDTRNFRVSMHSSLRQKERLITLPNVIFVLLHGFHEESKTQFSDEFQTWKYAIRGKTLEGVEARIIVAFEDEMIIVTAICLTRGKR